MRLIGPISGYSTQAQISLDVADLINNARSVGANLRDWVHAWREKGLIGTDTQAQALLAITRAFEDGGFHPRVFHLAEIIGFEKGDEPDEYWVENQPISGPRVRQILPPPRVTALL